jgi:hypothetical protein
VANGAELTPFASHMDHRWTAPSNDFHYLSKCSRHSALSQKWFEEDKTEKNEDSEKITLGSRV